MTRPNNLCAKDWIFWPILIGLLAAIFWLAGCRNLPFIGNDTGAALNSAQKAQQSAAAGAVEAMKPALEKLPDSLPKKAIVYQREIADANLAPPSEKDRQAALDLTSTVLAGDAAKGAEVTEARIAAANQLDGKVRDLEAERKAAELAKESIIRQQRIDKFIGLFLWIGSISLLVGAVSVFGFIVFGIPQLRQAAFVAFGSAMFAFFTAYEAGTPLFGWLAIASVAIVVGSMVYTFVVGLKHGKTVKAAIKFTHPPFKN